MAQQDDYFYEIQLTNKQLVFYFMAGATGLVLSFLAGVMVGRGVDTAGAEVQAARPAVQSEKVVTEETLKPAPPAADELSYARRLESDRGQETLDKPKAVAPEATRPATSPARTDSSTRPQAPAAKPPASGAATVKASPLPATRSAGNSPPAAAGTFAIQVGAFKDKEGAESVMNRLKGKGYAAYVVAPSSGDGLYNVRVGSYSARADAERIQDKLREEKFKPFIVKN